MNLLAALRHYHSRGMRRAAVVFAIGWLGFAVAPCQAMGIESPSDAPHHGSMPADDCGHCLPSANEASGCASAAAADCLPAVTPLIDVRETDHPKPVAMPAPIAAELSGAGPVRALRGSRRAPTLPLPHASVQQRYCTFLK
jgi:hypothetical protein